MTTVIYKQPPFDPLAAITAKIEKVKSTYLRIERGAILSIDELLTLPSLRELDSELVTTPLKTPSSRAKLRQSLRQQIEAQDKYIQMHTITMIVEDMVKARTANEKASFYTFLQHTFDKYGVTPAQAVKEFNVDAKTQQETAKLILDGALVYVRENLRDIFTQSALYPDDAEKLKNNRYLSSGDKINALFAPVDDGTAQQLLTTLERAVQAYDKDADYMDYVDEIMPANVFYKVAAAPKEKEISERDKHIRNMVEKSLLHLMQASNVIDRSDKYDDVRAAFNAHKVTPDKYLGLYADEHLRGSMRRAIQEGALAYVHVKFIEAVRQKPTPEDEAIINDPNARPNDQLNALFRNSGKEALALLTVLEEAGFDYDEADLTHRILMAGNRAKADERALRL